MESLRRVVASVGAEVVVVFRIVAVVAWDARSEAPCVEKDVSRDVVRLLLRVFVVSCVFWVLEMNVSAHALVHSFF